MLAEVHRSTSYQYPTAYSMESRVAVLFTLAGLILDSDAACSHASKTGVSSPRSRRLVRFVLSSWSSLALLDCVHRFRSSLRLVVGLVVGCGFQIGAWCSVHVTRVPVPQILVHLGQTHTHHSHTQGIHTHTPTPAPAHNRIYTHILLEPCQSDPALSRLPGSLHHRGVTRGPPL